MILIDTTYFHSVYLLLESVRRLGFNPDEIKYIVHTHAHDDHAGGTKALVEFTGTRTFLRKEDIKMLKENPFPFDVDNLLIDEAVIRLGNTEIRTIHTPGHTDGTM